MFWNTYLFIYLSDVFGVSNIVNYLIIQQFDISRMSDVLNHLNIVCPLNIQSGLAWPVQIVHWIFNPDQPDLYRLSIEYSIRISLIFTDCPLNI